MRNEKWFFWIAASPSAPRNDVAQIILPGTRHKILEADNLHPVIARRARARRGNPECPQRLDDHPARKSLTASSREKR